MIPKNLDSITAADIEALIGTAERRDLEFKRELPGGRDDDIKEFLGDVSCMANTVGGDLIFGVEEAEGVAVGVTGIPGPADALTLRLESSLRSGLEPRVQGLRLAWIPLTEAKGVLIIRSPASLAAPHRVIFKRSNRFWARHSSGKYEMDTNELRAAFTGYEDLINRFRAIHANDVQRATDGLDMPFRLAEDPAVVVSIIPADLFRQRRDLALDFDDTVNPPRLSYNLEQLLTVDGVLKSSPPEVGFVRSYSYTYTTGRISGAWTIGRDTEVAVGRKERLAWPKHFEGELACFFVNSTRPMADMEVEGPWYVFTTVINSYATKLVTSEGGASRAAWRHQAFLGDFVVEAGATADFTPTFRAFWRHFGLQRPLRTEPFK